MSVRISKKTWLPILISGLVITTCLSGCLSEILLEVPAVNSPALAIRGSLTAGENPGIVVKITQVSDFVAADIPQPVSGAIVILLDDKDHSLEIPMQEAGVYALEIPAQQYALDVLPGKAYQLTVATPNGKIYVSSVETLYPAPVPVEVAQVGVKREAINGAGNIEEQEFLQFLLTTPLDRPDRAERSYLKWTFSGTYKFQESNLTFPYPNTRTCFFTDPLNGEKVVAFNGSESNQALLSGFFLLEEPYDYRFSEGFYLTVRQESLSEGAYRYWSGIGEIIERSGNLFESPPGKVGGNFRNIADDTEEVFGYFYCTEQQLIRYYVPPAADRVLPFCPLLAAPGDDSVPAVCLDCQSRPGSTLIKPAYWKE